jgi:hypothetical protein
LSEKQENIAQYYFSIIPNPADNNINLNFNEMQNNFEIKLIDMTGRLAFDQKYLEARAVNLPSTNFSNGVYFIRIIAKEFTTGQFVVINHTSDQ